MGGKKPDALFSRSGDSDTPLPLLAPYLKKIMTKLMLLCFWQHINIIMRSIRPRRSAALALSPFLSFIFIIILADVGSLKRVKGWTFYVERSTLLLVYIKMKLTLEGDWERSFNNLRHFGDPRRYCFTSCVCIGKYFNLKFPHQTCPSAKSPMAARVRSLDMPPLLVHSNAGKQKLSYD